MWFLALNLIWNAFAYNPNDITVTGHETPAELVGVGLEEHLGRQLDLSLQFTDEDGVTAPLGSFFHKGRPVLMAMVYYTCPGLCNYHLNGVTDALKTMKWTTGQEFDVIAVSMNHDETPALAQGKLQNYLKEYGRDGQGDGWHFLVGRQANVKALADQLGFKFKWNDDTKQFAHAAISYIITPGGKISRYLPGIQPEPGTLKLSLLEASDGKIGSFIEQTLLYCFKFDPKKGKFTLYAWNLMRAGALLMVLLLGLFLLPVWWREQRR